MTTTVSIDNTMSSAPEVRLTKICTCCKLYFSLYSDSTGTNAWLKAPSANSRRKKFGILKATKKASINPPAPKTPNNTISRTKPKIRDNMVMLLTTMVERNNRLFAMRTYLANVFIGLRTRLYTDLLLQKLTNYSTFITEINGLGMEITFMTGRRCFKIILQPDVAILPIQNNHQDLFCVPAQYHYALSNAAAF